MPWVITGSKNPNIRRDRETQCKYHFLPCDWLWKSWTQRYQPRGKTARPVINKSEMLSLGWQANSHKEARPKIDAYITGYERSWSDHYTFLRNCPPTPPLSQHFAFTFHLEKNVGLGFGRWAVSQKCKMIQRSCVTKLIKIQTMGTVTKVSET